MRGKDFIRVSMTERCMTMYGRTINYETGHEWNFYEMTREQSNEQKILHSESLPFSHMQVALVYDRKLS